eukprot:SAG11_NODE_404_length_9736_cov_20.243022_12_plen_45_part_00
MRGNRVQMSIDAASRHLHRLVLLPLFLTVDKRNNLHMDDAATKA